jgi:hypothetical protein
MRNGSEEERHVCLVTPVIMTIGVTLEATSHEDPPLYTRDCPREAIINKRRHPQTRVKFQSYR